MISCWHAEKDNGDPARTQQPEPKPRYDDPSWQVPVNRMPDDQVNWPIIARFLHYHAEQRRLAEEAAKAKRPRNPLPAD